MATPMSQTSEQSETRARAARAPDRATPPRARSGRGLARLPGGRQGQRARPSRDRRLRPGGRGRRVRHAGLRLRPRRHPRPRPRLRGRASRRSPTNFEVLYASKAAPITAVYEICREAGLSVDVASGGELYTALRAGFEPGRIYMHGNNKTAAELELAIRSGVGHLIVDSLDEIDRLEAMLDRPAARADQADARDQAFDPLLRPDRPARLEVRLRARERRRRRSGRRGSPPPSISSWSASTPTSARRSSSSSRSSARSTRSPTSATSTCPSRRSSTSAAASGSPTRRATRRLRSRATPVPRWQR